MCNSPWSSASQHPSLRPQDVHVWRARLDLSSETAELFISILAEDEVNRAEQFAFLHDRNRFVIARGVLRTLVARYVNVRPDELRFCYARNGKPALAESGAVDQLCFNVSHSHKLALYVMALNRDVGIDVEYIRKEANIEIAQRYFAAAEQVALHALPENQQSVAFFNCWTRKEAYVKARGGGLSLPLDNFEVSLALGEAAVMLHIEDESERARGWSLKELALEEGYVGAVAVAGSDWRLRCWNWED